MPASSTILQNNQRSNPSIFEVTYKTSWWNLLIWQNRFSDSFFPFCASKWEHISDDLKNSRSIAEFKSIYKRENVPPKRGYFSINNKFGVRLLTKLRVGLSDLREHRFRHNFKNCPSPICKCKQEAESTEHFLARCPLYTNLRNNFLNNISDIVAVSYTHLTLPTKA